MKSYFILTRTTLSGRELMSPCVGKVLDKAYFFSLREQKESNYLVSGTVIIVGLYVCAEA